LVIQGQVDKWRIERVNSYNLYCAWVDTKDRISITDYLPLPYDDELKGTDMKESDFELYWKAKASGVLDFKWEVDENGKLKKHA